MQRKLSEKYYKRIRPIKIEGVSGFVWDKNTLLEFLDDAESDGYAILGGDVIRESDGKMEYTYDNWSIEKEREAPESFKDFVARCKDYTRQYISSYPISKGIVFAVVMSSDVTAGFTKM